MGAAEGPVRHEGMQGIQKAGDAVYGGDFKGFLLREGRQDAGNASCQHGFSGAGGTCKQQIVKTADCDFGGAARAFLSAEISEVLGGRRFVFAAGDGISGEGERSVAEICHRLLQVADSDGRYTANRSGFGQVSGGNDDGPESGRQCGGGNRQDAVDTVDAAVQAELAHGHDLIQRISRDLPGGGEERERDREIVE